MNDVEKPPNRGPILSYVTFGQDREFQIKVLYPVIATLLISRLIWGLPQMNIETPSSVQYAAIIGLGGILIALSWFTVVQMSEETNSPQCHTRRHQLGSVLGYLSLSGVLTGTAYIVFGILMIGRVPPLALFDWGIGFVIIGILALLFASLQYLRVISKTYENSDTRQVAVKSFLKAITAAKHPEKSEKPRADLYRTVLEHGRKLEEELKPTKMADERHLKSNLSDWLNSFEEHQTVSRERVISESRETATLVNKSLSDEKEKLEEICSQLDQLT